jgi:hypothetical protein
VSFLSDPWLHGSHSAPSVRPCFTETAGRREKINARKCPSHTNPEKIPTFLFTKFDTRIRNKVGKVHNIWSALILYTCFFYHGLWRQRVASLISTDRSTCWLRSLLLQRNNKGKLYPKSLLRQCDQSNRCAPTITSVPVVAVVYYNNDPGSASCLIPRRDTTDRQTDRQMWRGVEVLLALARTCKAPACTPVDQRYTWYGLQCWATSSFHPITALCKWISLTSAARNELPLCSVLACR